MTVSKWSTTIWNNKNSDKLLHLVGCSLWIRLSNFISSCHSKLAVWYSICCTYLEQSSRVYSYLLTPSYCKRYRLVFWSQGRGSLFSVTFGPNTIQCGCILLNHDMFHDKDSQINIQFNSTAPKNKHQGRKLN